MGEIKPIYTIPELVKKLSDPKALISNRDKEFANLAESLMRNFQIKKGKDQLYWMTEIEFYIYTDEHRDIITYPRNCPAGVWFFHPSGVDIAFESEADPQARTLVRKPELTSTSVFGGILIRGIVSVDDSAIYADGPIKVCDELFDQFNAIKSPKNFPKIVKADYPRIVSVKRGIREGMKEEGKTKVPKIRYYYRDWQIPEEKLIEEHDKYRMKEYRFYIDPRP